MLDNIIALKLFLCNGIPFQYLVYFTAFLSNFYSSILDEVKDFWIKLQNLSQYSWSCH